MSDASNAAAAMAASNVSLDRDHDIFSGRQPRMVRLILLKDAIRVILENTDAYGDVYTTAERLIRKLKELP